MSEQQVTYTTGREPDTDAYGLTGEQRQALKWVRAWASDPVGIENDADEVIDAAEEIIDAQRARIDELTRERDEWNEMTHRAEADRDQLRALLVECREMLRGLVNVVQPSTNHPCPICKDHFHRGLHPANNGCPWFLLNERIADALPGEVSNG